MKKLLAFVLLLPAAAHAQGTIDNFQLNRLNTLYVASSKSPEATVSGIINTILGLLGTIAVLLFLFAGFKWLTSQGSSDKIDEAKKLMGAAVVGIAIIFASYALSQFVIKSLFNETLAVPA